MTDNSENDNERTDPLANMAEESSEESLREKADDLDDETSWSMQQSNRIGARLGDAIGGAISTFAINTSLFVSRLTPFSHRFWAGMIKAGYKGVKSKGGADYVGHIVEQGQLKHVPVAYKDETESPVDDPRYVTSDGDWWKAPDQAPSTYMVGKVPTIWASSASNQLGNHVQAEVAEVLDAGDGVPVMENAQVSKITVDSDAATADGAIADGGYQQATEHVSVDNPGTLSDYRVPLDKGLDGAAARIVSMEKYFETYPSQVDPEEMEQQHLMGRLAEKDPKADRAFLMKIMLVVLGIIAIIVLGPPLVSGLFGGGGGGSVGGAILG